jgi:hypothetical protein
MVMIISDRAAASEQAAAGIAPASFKSATGPGRTSYTTTEYPALRRFRDIGFPIIPKPINPICDMNPPFY